LFSQVTASQRSNSSTPSSGAPFQRSQVPRQVRHVRASVSLAPVRHSQDWA
jgi:hypothetical protein